MTTRRNTRSFVGVLLGAGRLRQLVKNRRRPLNSSCLLSSSSRAAPLCLRLGEARRKTSAFLKNRSMDTLMILLFRALTFHTLIFHTFIFRTLISLIVIFLIITITVMMILIGKIRIMRQTQYTCSIFSQCKSLPCCSYLRANVLRNKSSTTPSFVFRIFSGRVWRTKVLLSLQEVFL